MTTGRQIITLALKDAGVIGVGQTPLADDINDAQLRLNWMLTQWRRKRWLIMHLVELEFVSTGVAEYTVGPQGNFNTSQRPDKIEYAFLRQINVTAPALQPDYPLAILQSREDYSRITLKELQSFSQVVYYEPTYPTGTLFVWPRPNASIYEIHIGVKAVLEQISNLSATINLPDDYAAAMNYCLAQRLRAAYRMPPDASLDGFARDALATLRMANYQIAALRMPGSLVRPGIYNVYSDQAH